MSVNVNTTTNTIVVQNANQTITVVDNENANIVNVTQPLVNVIEVASPGPQGPAGSSITGGATNYIPVWSSTSSLTTSSIYVSSSTVIITGSLSVSGSITSSLFGTASWAINALTASYALNGGGGATFPYSGSAIITGSLIVSGSTTGINTNFNGVGLEITDVDGRALFIGGTAYNRQLLGLEGNESINWGTRILNDGDQLASVDWNNRQLYEPTNTYVAFEYSNDTYTQTQLYHQQSIAANTVAKALSNTALQWSGQSLSGTITGSSSAGDVVYLDADGIWKQVDSATSTSEKMLGINIDGTNVLIEGDITMTNTMIDNPGYGFPIYLKGVGTLSTVIPGLGYIRVVGHCYERSSVTTTNWVVKFRPSNDWYKI
jgi:hypothetical protein